MGKSLETRRTHFTNGRSAVDYDAMVEDDFQARRMARKNLSRKEFGARLFNLAVERDWSQAELARQSGIPRDSISNYMRGNYLPDAQNLKKLANVFGLKPEDLLPNIIEAEVKMASPPALDIRSGADPMTSWVRINRLVHSAGLSEILAVIEKHSVKASDD